MSPKKAKEATRFDEEYQILKGNVDKLRQSDISNIDELVPLVEQSSAAYQRCKERLDAVEALINNVIEKE